MVKSEIYKQTCPVSGIKRMKGHSEEIDFIIYINNPVCWSIRISKRCKGKTRADKNKKDMIAGTAARLAGIRKQSTAARIT